MSDYAGGEKTKQESFSVLPGLSRPGLFARSLSAHGLLIGFVLVYAFLYLILLQFFPDSGPENPMGLVIKLLATISILTVISLFCQSCYEAFKRGGAKTPVSAIGQVFWQKIRDTQSSVPAFTMLVIMAAFSFVYVQVKKFIPVVAPFSWDEYFFELDKVLHFGVSPWKWLEPVFAGNPLLVSVLNFNYNIWFFVMWSLVVYFAFRVKDPVLRTRFFLTFFLAWAVGGSFLAMVFSSAGPAFYGRLGITPDVYAPLMAQLREVNEVYSVWALGLQDAMWLGYTGQGINIGISAMPSMHNAATMLFFMACWQLNKKVGIGMAVHGILISIGSVYLGWHYAVDIYLGWAVALVAWYVSGFVARWWHNRPDVRAFDDSRAGIDSLQHRA
ncbi:hypothetical protein MNBD_ALPHA08-1127 [hydrothermal vent metagenome]|uniref:Inositolphosphotransferase Aur1/Ipt1 domain-containing protein n=1 Tax=hydrothermal vent metagenome TaxID=652676 RepID=A0A3B0T0R1_9ZZZZ